MRDEEQNLFGFIHQSIVETSAHLGIGTKIRLSSEIDVDHEMKAQDKVIALSRALGADCYVNAVGGIDLYDRDAFRAQGIELQFLRAKQFEYAQFGRPFVPWLSIVDVMMFNAPEQVRAAVRDGYELV